jgi:hypothetical protein
MEVIKQIKEIPEMTGKGYSKQSLVNSLLY